MLLHWNSLLKDIFRRGRYIYIFDSVDFSWIGIRNLPALFHIDQRRLQGSYLYALAVISATRP